MKVKTSKLTDHALDWAVAVCGGRGVEFDDPRDPWLTRNGVADQPLHSYTPSTDWAQGGPIIERERIGLSWVESNWRYMDGCWSGVCAGQIRYAPTPLIAAMRAYVESRLGDEIEVHEELLK